MPLEVIEVETGDRPSTSVIVLHGLGADGNDFVPVCGELDLAAAGGVRFVFPSAPVRPVTLNGGYPMRAWYDILDADMNRREDDAGLRESQTAVEALIAIERSRGIASKRIVLMGFSQGCAMTLLAGLRYGEPLAGLVGLSGYLPLADMTVSERSAANADTPIFLAHGRSDPLVPLTSAAATRQLLCQLGYCVEWHDYAMQHSVCPQEIADLNQWLLRVLAS